MIICSLPFPWGRGFFGLMGGRGRDGVTREKTRTSSQHLAPRQKDGHGKSLLETYSNLCPHKNCNPGAETSEPPQ